jgi:hypothetical protein
VEVLAAGRSTEEAALAAEAPAHAVDASGSAVAATPAASTASAEPSRKRKQGFSTLR